MADTLKTAPSVLMITFLGTNGASRPVANTVHLLYSTSTITGENAAEIANKASIAWQDEILDLLNNSYSYNGGRYIDLDSTDGVTGSFSPVAGHPAIGQTTNPGVSPQISLLVHKDIVGSGRGKRKGRMFLSPFDEAEVGNNGLITGATRTLWQGKITAFWSALDSMTYNGGSEVTVVQPHWSGDDDPGDAGGEWPSTGVSVSTGFTLDAKAATQRRRLRG